MAQTNNFLEIWERVKKETNLSTFTQLAELVETTHQYVSRKKAKNDFLVMWAFVIAQKFNLSTDWIMTGKGPKRHKEGDEINPLLAEVNEWLNEEGKHKDKEFEILFRNQMIRAFFDYEKWVDKKTKQENSESFSLNKKVA